MPRKTKMGPGRRDAYYEMAKTEGYRSRASYKLIHLNNKYGFLNKARVIIDLCAAPGGWIQVCDRIVTNGIIVGVDLDRIRDVPSKNTIILLQNDVTTKGCLDDVRSRLQTLHADVVLNDGAPNMGASWQKDSYQQVELSLSCLRIASRILREGGTFVTKLFRSQYYYHYVYACKQLFKTVEATKPSSSRATSAECYIVCRGYINPKSIDPKLFNPNTLLDDREVQSEYVGSKNDSLYCAYHKITIEQLLESKNPLELLETNNEVIVPQEWVDEWTEGWKRSKDPRFKRTVAPLEKDSAAKVEERAPRPLPRPEFIYYFKDLSVLGKSEKSELVRWHARVNKTHGKAHLKSHRPQKEEITIHDAQERYKRELKRQKKKELRRKAKDRLRLELKIDRIEQQRPDLHLLDDEGSVSEKRTSESHSRSESCSSESESYSRESESHSDEYASYSEESECYSNENEESDESECCSDENVENVENHKNVENDESESYSNESDESDESESHSNESEFSSSEEESVESTDPLAENEKNLRKSVKMEEQEDKKISERVRLNRKQVKAITRRAFRAKKEERINKKAEEILENDNMDASKLSSLKKMTHGLRRQRKKVVVVRKGTTMRKGVKGKKVDRRMKKDLRKKKR